MSSHPLPETLAEARDPSTSPARLAALAKRHAYDHEVLLALAQNVAIPAGLASRLLSMTKYGARRRVCEALAENPNLPRELFETCARESPAHLLRNPALPLWLTEEPTPFAALSDLLLGALVTAARDQEWLFSMALQRQRWSLDHALAKHPKLPAPVVEVLVRRTQNGLLGPLLQNQTLSLERRWELLGHALWPVRRAAARHALRVGGLPGERLALWRRVVAFHAGAPASFTPEERALLLAGGPWLQAAALADPATPHAVLARGLESPSLGRLAPRGGAPWVVEGVARNPTLTHSEQRALRWLRGQGREHHVVRGLARHPSLAPELWRSVTAGASGEVRGWLAARPDLPPREALCLWESCTLAARLALLANPAVRVPLAWWNVREAKSQPGRAALAGRADAPAAYLGRLARDESPAVRRRLAQNPACPAGALLLLLDDEDEAVSAAAAAHPSAPAGWVEAREALARDTGAPADHLWMLLAGGPRSLQIAATHPQSPAALLERLAGDPRPEARASLLRRAALPTALRRGLLHDPHPTVRRAFLARADLALEDWARLVHDPEEAIRLAVVCDPRTPTEIARRALERPTRGMARALARHPSRLTPRG